MAQPSTVILGTGSYAPSRVLTNAELSKMVDTSDEWITTRSGIRERRIAAPGEHTSDMAVHAARAALADAQVSADEIDLLIVATVTADMALPAASCIIQHKLGLRTTTACFDLNAACSGFVYALDTGCAMLTSGRYHKALIIGVEKLSSVVDWTDRSTCVLFGDGAGAAVIGLSDTPGIGLIGTRLGAYGDGVDLLNIPKGGSSHPATAESIANREHFLRMKGKEVFKRAVFAMERASREILEQHKIHADHIACVIPHQANLRIIDAIAQYLELPIERFYVNVDRYGNTSSASIPIALDEARRAGRIKSGDLILLVAFGAGLTYGAALIRW
ncbi:ketoacyl-ACP synthase III [Horticoccus luteus]|uniref:Beta-ketoacyl-[acyl-carrier-protein] synthase III n=1 Tax=Horticoccus luteus TaxID=2862869 RepID=A0A8F9TZ42_9BACT|nr:beta-ketoacyl-ACP synthase III [Horticoccus luteus]QYM80177.1 ketoacyl-ACP synthase III [Horticoccus luteus]